MRKFFPQEKNHVSVVILLKARIDPADLLSVSQIDSGETFREGSQELIGDRGKIGSSFCDIDVRTEEFDGASDFVRIIS